MTAAKFKTVRANWVGFTLDTNKRYFIFHGQFWFYRAIRWIGTWVLSTDQSSLRNMSLIPPIKSINSHFLNLWITNLLCPSLVRLQKYGMALNLAFLFYFFICHTNWSTQEREGDIYFLQVIYETNELKGWSSYKISPGSTCTMVIFFLWCIGHVLFR